MKKLLLIFTIVVSIGVFGSCEKEVFVFDYYTTWYSYEDGYTGNIFSIELMNGLAFYSAYDKNGNHIAKRHGIGNYEKVSNTKIIFSDFIITDGNDVSRFIIDSAVYDVHLSIPILVISYRKNVNPETGFPWYTEIPAPIWSDEVMTDDFLLQDE